MLYWLEEHPVAFPAVEDALDEPNGLLAAGGALTPEWLLTAYMNGIFPWFNAEDPILWWTPDPRMVLYPNEFRCRRSLAKRIRNGGFTLTFDTAFKEVMQYCGSLRDDTWISPQMVRAYHDLHLLGYAHSLEVWHDGELVGGLYGLALGRIFYGESMFSRCPDASKVALAHLATLPSEYGFALIDCQVHSDHLASLGAREIARSEFNAALRQHASLERWHPPMQ
ncbi:leucyl/phenylalanyl-tRNA--protein transferase [Zymobacter palmae]|uniref:Leucyl/phenylalanyl-tRNA--protein transferase n=1 Tax=Zymobacter palmae TaxID=33074 RepID=A0A348HCI1_9GAMM|nr:leucyl/phenylalanyl-tRNA--protein transferase [Zymobacter palmae]BBG29333.1 Leu/Phe-tRNA-protein transferase [Zymobacter palmae]